MALKDWIKTSAFEGVYAGGPVIDSIFRPARAEYDDGRLAGFAATHARAAPGYVRHPLSSNSTAIIASGLGAAALTAGALKATTNLKAAPIWFGAFGAGLTSSIAATVILRQRRAAYLNKIIGNTMVRDPQRLLEEDQALPRAGLPSMGYANELKRQVGELHSSLNHNQGNRTADVYDALNYPAWALSSVGVPAHLSMTLAANGTAGNYSSLKKGAAPNPQLQRWLA